MQTRRRKCHKTNTRVLLLDLPDGAVESIASFLQPVAMAKLQCTSRHLRALMSQDRLWHNQLVQSYSFWTSAGILPVRGRKDGETWKQLVSTAYGLKVPRPDDGEAVYTINYYNTAIRDDWDKGKGRVVLDFHLCIAEARSSVWSIISAQPYFQKERIVLLLEFVYFLWFEERQLSRGAKMLAKVLDLLADLEKARAPPQRPLWHTDVDIAMAVSSAGSYLIDLLQLRVAHVSPLAIAAPEAFLRACSGQDCPVASAPMADKIEWCGGEYDVADLKAALAVLLPTGTPQDQLLAQEYSDPWAPDSWDLLGPPAQSLLKDLAQATFNLHNEWELPGAVLLNKAEAMSEMFPELKPSRVCRAHHLFAGATLLLRQDKGKAVTVHAEHGLMFEDARQHQRAAYYYKQAILLGCQTANADLDYNVDSVLVGIAEAYDGEWQDTGSISSFQKAFEWRKFLVQRLVGKADKTPALCERTCECLQSLGLLLEDHSCRGGSCPQLQGCDSHLLAVGAYVTGMSQIDANAAVMAWLHTHIQMADAAEKAFMAFLEGHYTAPQPECQQANATHLPLGTAAVADPPTHTGSAHPTSPAPASSLQHADPTASTSSQSSGDQNRPALPHRASLATIEASPATAEASPAIAEASPATAKASPARAEASPGAASPAEASPPADAEASPVIGSEASPCTATSPPTADEEQASSSTPAAPALDAPPAGLTLKHVGFLGSLAHALVHLHQPSQGLGLLRAAASIMRTHPPHPPHWFQGFPDPRTLHAHVLMDLGVSLLGERLYEEALDVFMEGLVIAERQRLGDRILSTFHDHVAHTILQLRQQRAVHNFSLTNGDRMEISWRHAEEHALTAIRLGRQCTPAEAALEASPLTTLGDIASAKCCFPFAKQRYMEAYERLAGSDSSVEALSASNAAEAVTTLAAVADMMLKMGEVEEASKSLTTSLALLQQHPGQLPALQVKRTQLYLTTLQMQIHIYKGDLAGAKHQLDTCMGLTHTGAEYRPGFIRYDEAIMAAAQGNTELALQQFQDATEVAQQQQDKQLETMAATAVGLLMTGPGQNSEQQEVGWKTLQQGMALAVRVGDRLCEAHAAEGMLKALACEGFGKKFKNKRELKRSLQEQVQVISKDIGQAAIDASRRMLSFAGL